MAPSTGSSMGVSRTRSKKANQRDLPGADRRRAAARSPDRWASRCCCRRISDRSVRPASWRESPRPRRRPLVGLNTGAGGRWLYKQWTLEHQKTFLQQDDRRRRPAWCLLGGPEEVERHRRADRLGAPDCPVFDAGNDHSVAGFAARSSSSVRGAGDRRHLRDACRRRAQGARRRVVRTDLERRDRALRPRREDGRPSSSTACAATCRGAKSSRTARRCIEPDRVVAAVERWL